MARSDASGKLVKGFAWSKQACHTLTRRSLTSFGATPNAGSANYWGESRWQDGTTKVSALKAIIEKVAGAACSVRPPEKDLAWHLEWMDEPKKERFLETALEIYRVGGRTRGGRDNRLTGQRCAQTQKPGIRECS